jgi:hypothetical protein
LIHDVKEQSYPNDPSMMCMHIGVLVACALLSAGEAMPLSQENFTRHYFANTCARNFPRRLGFPRGGKSSLVI